jgi:hypothetical protein
MKKSFKVNRPTSRPSIPHSSGTGGFGKSMKQSFHKQEKQSWSSNESLAGTPKVAKQGSSYLPGQRRGRSNWLTVLIVLLVLFVCCLVVLCIAGVYLWSQGQITIPSFG